VDEPVTRGSKDRGSAIKPSKHFARLRRFCTEHQQQVAAKEKAFDGGPIHLVSALATPRRGV
jgi:hypothetical protein